MQKKWQIKIVLAMLGVLGLATVLPAAQKAGMSMAQAMRKSGFKAETAQWTSNVTQTEEGTNKVTKSVSKMWISGDKVRMEAKDPKTKETMVLIDDGKENYFYYPEKKEAMKVGGMMESMYKSMMNSEAVAKAMENRKKAKKSGTEEISGKSCAIYEYKMTIGETTSDIREWIWEKESFPMKSIVKTPKGKMKMMGMNFDVPASTSENVVTEIVLGKAIPASMFKIPEGIKIQDMGEMPGMQAVPQEKGQSGKERSKSGDEGAEAGKDGEVPAEVQNLLKGLF